MLKLCLENVLEIVTKWYLNFFLNSKCLISAVFLSKNLLKQSLDLFLNFMIVYGEFSTIIFERSFRMVGSRNMF